METRITHIYIFLVGVALEKFICSVVFMRDLRPRYGTAGIDTASANVAKKSDTLGARKRASTPEGRREEQQ